MVIIRNIEIRNIPARDRLPGQKDYQQILIATAEASTEFDNNHTIGNIINTEEDVSWRTAQGSPAGQWAMIQMADFYRLMRIVIQWDPELPRKGKYVVEFWDDNDQISPLTITGQRDGVALFTLIDIEAEDSVCNRIKIIFMDPGLNGIATLALYGYEVS